MVSSTFRFYAINSVFHGSTHLSKHLSRWLDSHAVHSHIAPWTQLESQIQIQNFQVTVYTSALRSIVVFRALRPNIAAFGNSIPTESININFGGCVWRVKVKCECVLCGDFSECTQKKCQNKNGDGGQNQLFKENSMNANCYRHHTFSIAGHTHTVRKLDFNE